MSEWRLEKLARWTTIRCTRASLFDEFPGLRVRTAVNARSTQRSVTMKKLLALMFALAITVSMSSFSFAQAAGGDKPADQKAEKKEKKSKKSKKEKKEKKDEAKDEKK
jgi:hypothetical protein